MLKHGPDKFPSINTLNFSILIVTKFSINHINHIVHSKHLEEVLCITCT